MEGVADTQGTPETSEFWNQFAGSSSANVLVIVVLGIVAGIRKLCERKSKCKSHIHCCCLELDIKDQTLRERPDISDDTEMVPV